MVDARHLFAYTFYILAASVLVTHQVMTIRATRAFRRQHPEHRGWRRWSVPTELRRDPAYRAITRWHWISWLLVAGLLSAADYSLRLSGSSAPHWLHFFQP